MLLHPVDALPVYACVCVFIYLVIYMCAFSYVVDPVHAFLFPFLSISSLVRMQTSNPSSNELQTLPVGTSGKAFFEEVARLCERYFFEKCCAVGTHVTKCMVFVTICVFPGQLDSRKRISRRISTLSIDLQSRHTRSSYFKERVDHL